MRAILLAASLLLAGPALAQQDARPSVPPSAAMPTAEPAPGRPDVQSGVPLIGDGRGGDLRNNPPNTTERAAPTGQATEPPPRAAAPTPVIRTPAPPPGTSLGLTAEEREMMSALQRGRIEGRVTIPDDNAAILVQPVGRDWRQFHNRTLTWVGGVAIVGMLLVLGAFYAMNGRLKVEGGLSGRTIQRFNLLERANHWMVASSFIVLAITGLNLTFGRWTVLPILGPEAFYWFSHYGKIAHNFIAFPFTLGIVVMLILWARDNIPERLDLDWIKKGGGFIGRGHPEARRFNAGQKMVFWLTVLGGGVVAISGYLLIFPFWGPMDVNDMQIAHVVHSLLSVVMIAAMIAHIYIGSLGMEGAYDAMGSGEVDLAWAKEHHGLWVQEEMEKARREVGGLHGARAQGAD